MQTNIMQQMSLKEDLLLLGKGLKYSEIAPVLFCASVWVGKTWAWPSGISLALGLYGAGIGAWVGRWKLYSLQGHKLQRSNDKCA